MSACDYASAVIWVSHPQFWQLTLAVCESVCSCMCVSIYPGGARCVCGPSCTSVRRPGSSIRWSAGGWWRRDGYTLVQQSWVSSFLCNCLENQAALALKWMSLLKTFPQCNAVHFRIHEFQTEVTLISERPKSQFTAHCRLLVQS